MSIFKKLFGQKNSDGSPSEEKSKYFPEEQLPIDERFTHNFRKNGGKFLYCENLEELNEAFDNILLENDWYEKEVFCTNEMLISKFSSYNLQFSENCQAAFFFSQCESLVADGGAILISSNQIKQRKPHELPDNFVVFATTSQLVNTIGEGLRKIKTQYQNHIPTNITAINNFERKKEDDFMTYGSSSKNLYLLLLEDL